MAKDVKRDDLVRLQAAAHADSALLSYCLAYVAMMSESPDQAFNQAERMSRAYGRPISAAIHEISADGDVWDKAYSERAVEIIRMARAFIESGTRPEGEAAN